MWTSPDLKNIKMAGIKLSTKPLNAKRPLVTKTVKTVAKSKNPLGLMIKNR